MSYLMNTRMRANSGKKCLSASGMGPQFSISVRNFSAMNISQSASANRVLVRKCPAMQGTAKEAGLGKSYIQYSKFCSCRLQENKCILGTIGQTMGSGGHCKAYIRGVEHNRTLIAVPPPPQPSSKTHSQDIWSAVPRNRNLLPRRKMAESPNLRGY